MKCQWELKDILCFAAVRAEVLPKNQSREENHKQSIFEHDLKIYQIYKGQEKFPDITINITADILANAATIYTATRIPSHTGSPATSEPAFSDPTLAYNSFQ